MSEVTEAELKEKAVAPRVTQEDVDAYVKEVKYLYSDTLTVCQIIGQNGFSFTGESACADPANYNKVIGERISFDQAKKKIWGFLGFELKTKLDLVSQAMPKTSDDFETYVGTKVVHAREMTLGHYNDVRGWDMPADESPNKPGYIIEYADGGEANMPDRFKGYISWSPKDVFEKSYVCLSGSKPKETNFIDRMKMELAELNAKYAKLTQFLNTDMFENLSDYDKSLMFDQHTVMGHYRNILGRRIARAE